MLYISVVVVLFVLFSYDKLNLFLKKNQKKKKEMEIMRVFTRQEYGLIMGFNEISGSCFYEEKTRLQQSTMFPIFLACKILKSP